MSWRRSSETSLDVSFETYLRRHWDVQRDVVTTSLRRLVAGWVVATSAKLFSFKLPVLLKSNILIPDLLFFSHKMRNVGL